MDHDESTTKRPADADALNVGGSPRDSQATLCIYADDLDPEVVTAIVNCAPSMARRKGESYPERPKIRPAAVGQWFLEAPNELSFNDKIRFLLDATSNDGNVWHDLAESHRLELRAVIFLRSWTEGFELPNGTVAEIALRKWSFSLSMYSADGEEVLDAFLRRDRKDGKGTLRDPSI
jgi:hypothetical protein